MIYGSRRSSGSLALLFATTVLTSVWTPISSASAQVIIGGKPAKADDGATGVNLFGVDADNGVNGPSPAPHTNGANITSAGTAYFGDGRGGDGGDGGSAFDLCASGFPPLCVPGIAGGDGGDGGNGGAIDITNAATLTTSNNNAPGMRADSSGGNGGDGAWAAQLLLTDGGEGGNGGNGGSASAIAMDVSRITTTGVGSHGILVNASGGNGGDGGLGGAVGAGIGGDGGRGGSGGTAYGENRGFVETRGDFADGMLVRSAGGVGGDGAGGGGLIAGGGGNGGLPTIGGAATGVNSGMLITFGNFANGMTVQSVGGGGDGGEVFVRADGNIIADTADAASGGIVVQSIGGGGGNGGDTWSAGASFGSNVSVAATVNVGGNSGDGNTAGNVFVENAMAITTYGSQSSAIVAQAIGGGGGNGGSSTGATANLQGSGVSVNANVSIGATGGTGSTGGIVEVRNRGNLTSYNDFSNGILAQSVGGGGGVGGSSSAKNYSLGSGSGTSVSANIGIGGKGGSGGDAMAVTVDNSGVIETNGYQSSGIVAMAVGGGGGMAGAAKAGNESLLGGGSTTVSVGASIGLPGGGAGNGGDVKVFNRGRITTRGEDSYGIAASSIGGGGGTGGSATASAKAEYAIGGAVAGGGGGAGDGLSVFVDNQAGGDIHTYAARSIGIFAQSVGGSGGNGGAGDGTGDGGTVGVALSIGGWAAGGGDGGSVRVDNAASIVTEKDYAHGVMAQSVGGSGGLGGAAGTSTAGDSVAIGVSMGGMGGEGGVGKDVRVNNLASGVITTRGNNAYGIFAQSVGGGGGAAGAGSTEGESDSVVVTATIGGIGGEGNEGGYVEVNNDGRIETFGFLSHGIFAQSVGGGGGASGAAANATSGSSTKIGVVTGLVAGNGSNGGDVVVNNNGQIETWGAGAHGIMAQSVGGSGGYGGVVSSDAEGDGGFNLGVGGVGGGGGYGGDAKGKTSAALSIGGSGGGGGDGGDVTVIRTGTITTYGKDSVAIMAQSVGGGGGVGGAGFGRFATDDNGAGPNSFAFNTPSGKQGTGGIVRIEQTGAIETFGDRGHGIVAQAVGGGGGMGGTASLAMGESGAGSNGGVGDANAVNALANSQVVVHGASSYALFGQSATGQGNAQAVTLTAQSNLFAQGADSVAVYGESTAQGARGDIMINLNGAYTVGGSADGRAVMMVGGANNRVNNHSLLYALGDTYEYQYVGAAPVAGPVPTNAILESLLDDFSPLAISGTSGNDQVDNTPGALGMGRVIGNVDLGGGNNGFHNGANASMVGLSYINLGGGDFLNDGLMTSQGIGVVATIDVGGGFIQSGAGDLVTDIDLNTQTNDQLLLTGNGNFNGEMPLNFLSIDQLN